MRPFKFFFAISVGLILFFFVARVLILAFFIAAVMSVLFFVFRKIRNFFRHLAWEDYDEEYYEPSRPRYRRRQLDYVEPLFESWEIPYEKVNSGRSIYVQ